MSNLYPVYLVSETVGTFLFQFESSNQVIYNIDFSKADYLFDILDEHTQHVYTISFFPISTKEIKFDKRVSETIMATIIEFINSKEAALIYICDSVDERQIFRQKIFIKWFNSNENKAYFKHEARIIDFKDFSIFAGLLCKTNDDTFEYYLKQIDDTLLNENK